MRKDFLWPTISKRFCISWWGRYGKSAQSAMARMWRYSSSHRAPASREQAVTCREVELTFKGPPLAVSFHLSPHDSPHRPASPQTKTQSTNPWQTFPDSDCDSNQLPWFIIGKLSANKNSDCWPLHGQL